MVEIQCLVCKNPLQMPSYIDPDDYDGQVICQECDALLHIKLRDSKVKKYKIIKYEIQPPNIEFSMNIPPRSNEVKEDE